MRQAKENENKQQVSFALTDITVTNGFDLEHTASVSDFVAAKRRRV